jgi:lipopolysaccharide export system protein LptA
MAVTIGTGATQPAPIVFAPARGVEIRINAGSIDVRDREGVAVFGNARYSQGDIRLWCSTLIVRYRAASAGAQPAVEQVECRTRDFSN